MVRRKDYILLSDKVCFWPEEEHPLLGRICEDANEPNRNYFPLDPSPYHSKGARPFYLDVRDPNMIVKGARSRTASVTLDNIFKALRAKQRDQVATLRAERVRLFTLPQEDEVLSSIKDDTSLLAKINDQLRRKDSLYMIVGYMTMINAQFSSDESQSANTEIEASLTAIIEQALQAAGTGPLRLPELVAAVKKSTELSSSWTATYVEETVVAVKYRQLAKKWKILTWPIQHSLQLHDARFSEEITLGLRETGRLLEFTVTHVVGSDQEHSTTGLS